MDFVLYTKRNSMLKIIAKYRSFKYFSDPRVVLFVKRYKEVSKKFNELRWRAFNPRVQLNKSKMNLNET